MNKVDSEFQSSMHRFNKQERIRVKEWINKLSWKQNNPIWKKNINFYLKVLHTMIGNGKIDSPFNALPGDGPIKKLTLYDIPFPLRSNFTQNKDRSQSRISKDIDNFSQMFNHSK